MLDPASVPVEFLGLEEVGMNVEMAGKDLARIRRLRCRVLAAHIGIELHMLIVGGDRTVEVSGTAGSRPEAAQVVVAKVGGLTEYVIEVVES